MRLVRFLSAVTIGYLLGFAVWIIASLGYFERWERLDSVPTEIPRFFSVSWQQNTGGYVKITKPCDYSRPEFSFPPSPPGPIIDCLQRLELDPGGSTRITYVLDERETVWRRTHVDNTRVLYLGILCLTSAGLLAGGIANIIFEAARARHQRTAAARPDQPEP